MRRFFGILLVLVAMATVGGGQTTDKKPGKDDLTKQALMQIERDIGKANINRDYDFFDRVEADEFIFTDSGGGVTTKKEDLESVKGPANPDSKLLSYDVDDMKVMLYGKTAVVTGRSTLKGRNKDVPWTSQSRFTDVFVWRDNRWQLVAGHSSRIRQK
jgi:ketosteroid isomerase-like protein